MKLTTQVQDDFAKRVKEMIEIRLDQLTNRIEEAHYGQKRPNDLETVLLVARKRQPMMMDGRTPNPEYDADWWDCLTSLNPKTGKPLVIGGKELVARYEQVKTKATMGGDHA